MIKLVAEAKEEKSKTQSFLENAERNYALGVILVTLAVFLIPWLAMGEDIAAAFYRAMTVMVVASPCALVISTPATVLSAIGGVARRGILIKGGSHLERAATIDIVAVDKTGTLTFGKPSLTEIVTAEGSFPIDETLSEEAKSYLRLASALEARSEHPLAHAIISAADKLGISTPEATQFQATTGKGAQATGEGEDYLIGSERWIRKIGAGGVDQLAIHAQALQEKGCSSIRFIAEISTNDFACHLIPRLVFSERIFQPGLPQIIFAATFHQVHVKGLPHSSRVRFCVAKKVIDRFYPFVRDLPARKA